MRAKCHEFNVKRQVNELKRLVKGDGSFFFMNSLQFLKKTRMQFGCWECSSSHEGCNNGEVLNSRSSIKIITVMCHRERWQLYGHVKQFASTVSMLLPSVSSILTFTWFLFRFYEMKMFLKQKLGAADYIEKLLNSHALLFLLCFTIFKISA